MRCVENHSPYTHLHKHTYICRHTHPITIFEKHQQLTVLTHTHLQVHVLPFTYAHRCVWTHSVIQFQSCISLELSTGVMQTSGTSWKQNRQLLYRLSVMNARNANLNSYYPRLEVLTLHAKFEELLHSVFSWTVATLQLTYPLIIHIYHVWTWTVFINKTPFL